MSERTGLHIVRFHSGVREHHKLGWCEPGSMPGETRVTYSDSKWCGATKLLAMSIQVDASTNVSALQKPIVQGAIDRDMPLLRLKLPQHAQVF